MNIRCFHIGLSVWIVAFVSTGFSEDFQNRPAAAGMDTNVALGIQCVRGVNERCWATQYSTNPVQYHVEPSTNTAEWNLDQNLMGQMASKIKLLVPRYADPDTVYDETPNVAMLTVAGVWEEMEIGDEAGQFTETPAIGENPATYGDYPWRIYDVNLDERYNASWSLNQSSQTVSHVVSVYMGHGVGTTRQGAYNAAEADYEFITNWPASGIMQHCKIASWSNRVYQGGSGIYTEFGTPVGGTEVSSNWHEGYYEFNHYEFQVTQKVPVGTLVVESTDISPKLTHTYTTNVVISGLTDPAIAGTYYDHPAPGNPGVQWYKFDTWDNVILSGGVAWIYVWSLQLGCWQNNSGIEGYYSVINTNVSGSPFGTYEVIDTVTTNADPVDYSGTYYPESNSTVGVYWQGGSGYIYATGGVYVIYSSLTLDPANAYIVGTEDGWVAVNFEADTEVTSVPSATSPCCGIYLQDPFDSSVWAMGEWTATTNSGGAKISNTNEPAIPSWSKPGGGMDGTYTGSGTGYYGSVDGKVATINQWIDGYWDDPVPVYHTHSTTNIAGQEGETNTVFYECWLRKEAPVQTFSISSTNVEHRGLFFTRPIKPAYGTANDFNDEDLGLSEDVLNAVGDWTAWTYASPAIIENYWTSSLSTPPDITSEPEEPNSSICSGFQASEWLGILDWDFQYCTDE